MKLLCLILEIKNKDITEVFVETNFMKFLLVIFPITLINIYLRNPIQLTHNIIYSIL